MKRVLIILLLVFILITSLKIFNLDMYIFEMPSRLAKYHNTINISVVDNGKILDIENVNVVYKSENNESIETQVILDNKVEFEKGIYGINTFVFEIPDKNITIEVGRYNTNWWNVCEYDVSVDIINETVTLKVSITVEGNTKSYEKTKNMNEDDNKISIIQQL